MIWNETKRRKRPSFTAMLESMVFVTRQVSHYLLRCNLRERFCGLTAGSEPFRILTVSKSHYYIQNESGVTFVIEPDQDLKVIAGNRLSQNQRKSFDQPSLQSPKTLHSIARSVVLLHWKLIFVSRNYPYPLHASITANPVGKTILSPNHNKMTKYTTPTSSESLEDSSSLTQESLPAGGARRFGPTHRSWPKFRPHQTRIGRLRRQRNGSRQQRSFRFSHEWPNQVGGNG